MASTAMNDAQLNDWANAWLKDGFEIRDVDGKYHEWLVYRQFQKEQAEIRWVANEYLRALDATAKADEFQLILRSLGSKQDDYYQKMVRALRYTDEQIWIMQNEELSSN